MLKIDSVMYKKRWYQRLIYHMHTIFHYDESPGIKVANVIYPVCPGVWAGGINVLNLHCSFFIDSTCLAVGSAVSSAGDGVKSKDVSVRYWIEWERWRTSCVLSITKQPDLFNASTVFWTCSIQGENVHNFPPIKIHKTHDNNKFELPLPCSSCKFYESSFESYHKTNSYGSTKKTTNHNCCTRAKTTNCANSSFLQHGNWHKNIRNM